MENSLYEIKEIKWDWDEDDTGDVAEFVVIDGEKYVDVSYFNQKLKENEDRFELHKNTDAKTIQDQSDLIEELKAQIAESKILMEKRISVYEKNFIEQTDEIYKLKQQLAEKEKQIAELEEHDKIYHNQLAVEQLEKVKADINTYNKEHCFLSTEIDTCNKSIEIIDNQIKQLKEGK